ncbi:MspA family porin [Mycobacterium sp. SMC-4]|uniref:MspA family porin n=1 Tax=Mycobacterium sp. SMC-4 TaxID=2857059 RepID=UPI0021B4077E|nr:MspA family porin [Mycobacterium sp. SMC-4]UXA17324.1 MspA family porin [Mycobacterium sp. SMC-4]
MRVLSVVLTVAGVLAPFGVTAHGVAQPAPDTGPVVTESVVESAPPASAVPSSPPGYLETPEGWNLTVAAKDETHEPVPPLTTALTSREYLVGGTFTGEVSGTGRTELSGGSLVVGYRIGCGIIGGPVELLGIAGTTPRLSLDPNVEFPLTGQVKVNLRPGTVTLVPVGEKSFTGDHARVTVNGFRVRVDGCVGQSFMQSYATFTSSTADTSDIVTYAGQITVV